MRYLSNSLALLAGLVESSDPSHHHHKHLNVLMIIIDDLRADFFGAYNEREGAAILTPHLDNLAKQPGSTLFSKAYCQYALCSPSRISFLTGMRPDTTRVYDLKQRLRTHLPKAVSLPQHFRENGYFSKGVGKTWHRGHVDELSWSVEQPWVDRPHYALPNYKDAFKLRAQNMQEGKNKRLKPQLGPVIEVYDSEMHRDDVYTDGIIAHAAVAALKEAKSHLIASGHDKKKAFLVAVGFMKPHLPWCAPKRYWDAVNLTSVPFLLDVISGVTAKRNPLRAVPPGNELATYHFNHKILQSTEGQQELRRAYAACVHYVDAQVGVILTALNELGLQETTAVVFFSDHGYKLGEHGSWTKGTNLEEDTRVPLLFHTPLQFFSDQRRPPLRRLQATSISSIMFENSVVELVDVFPTLIDLCGLTPLPIGSQVLEGASLTPLLLDHSELGTNNKRRYHRLSRHKARHHQESNKVNDNSLIPKREKDYGCGAAFSQVLSGKIMRYSLRYSCEGEAVRYDVVGHQRSGYRLRFGWNLQQGRSPMIREKTLRKLASTPLGHL
jgi:iduronate 2-sulfatase